jgi:DNA-binding SARP family transcriptional activator
VERQLIDLRLLGPVRALAGGRDLEIGHPRQRGLLALLMADVGVPVPFDRLAELLWDGRPPRMARNVMAGYATRLRKALAAAAPRGSAVELAARDGGYVLHADRSAVDLYRFRDLAARGGRHDSPVEERARLLRQALDEWSGTPLTGLWGTGVESLRAGLEEQRRQVLNSFYDTQLRLGRAREILPELQWLIAEHPYAEDLMLRLVKAHSGSGNQAEALRQYAAFVERLARDLATRPGPELQAASASLLRRRPDPHDRAPIGADLSMPPAPEVFLGREEELRAMDVLATARPAQAAAVGPGRNLFVVSGLPGSGKTTLALQWAQQARDAFPDGRFFVAMRGHHRNLEPLSPAETLARVLLALGVPAADIPYGQDERAALYRTLLARHRVLIVLDDAAGPEQVRDLLPTGAHSSAVVVTARGRMPELTVRYFAEECALDVLDMPASLALFRRLVGTERVDADPAAADGLVRVSGRLPLTLQLNAAYAASRPEQSLASLLAQVTAAAESDLARGAMRVALDLSYRRLAPAQRQMFRWIGLIPGSDFEVEAAAALADCSLPEADRRLGALVQANLLTEYASHRYRLHDMVRQYAAEIAAADPRPVREKVLVRLLEWYRRCVEAASSSQNIQVAGFHRGAVQGWPPFGAVQEPAALQGMGIEWLDREKANLCAAVKHAAEMGLGRPSWQLADAMLGFIRLHPGGEDWGAAVTAALGQTALSGDGRAHTGMLLNMADVHYRVGHGEGEMSHARAAVRVARGARWRAGEALAMTTLGRAYWSVGELGLADRYLTRALRIHEDMGDWAGQANALARIARNVYDAGAMAEALRHFRRALTLVERADSQFGRVRLPGYLALTLRHMGHYEEAERWCTLAVRTSEAMSFHEGLAIALTCRAGIHSDLGAQARAAAAARLARVAIPHLSDPRIETDCLVHLGSVEAAADSPEEALRSFGQARQIAEKFGYRQGVARALAESAAVRVRLGRYEDAAAECRQALAVARGTALHPVVALALMSQADCALAAGRGTEAVAGYRRVAAIYQAGQQPLGEVRALLAWSRAVGAGPGRGRARRPATRGLRIAERLGVPEADSLRALV